MITTTRISENFSVIIHSLFRKVPYGRTTKTIINFLHKRCFKINSDQNVRMAYVHGMFTSKIFGLRTHKRYSTLLRKTRGNATNVKAWQRSSTLSKSLPSF